MLAGNLKSALPWPARGMLVHPSRHTRGLLYWQLLIRVQTPLLDCSADCHEAQMLKIYLSPSFSQKDCIREIDLPQVPAVGDTISVTAGKERQTEQE